MNQFFEPSLNLFCKPIGANINNRYSRDLEMEAIENKFKEENKNSDENTLISYYFEIFISVYDHFGNSYEVSGEFFKENYAIKTKIINLDASVFKEKKSIESIESILLKEKKKTSAEKILICLEKNQSSIIRFCISYCKLEEHSNCDRPYLLIFLMNKKTNEVISVIIDDFNSFSGFNLIRGISLNVKTLPMGYDFQDIQQDIQQDIKNKSQNQFPIITQSLIPNTLPSSTSPIVYNISGLQHACVIRALLISTIIWAIFEKKTSDIIEKLMNNPDEIKELFNRVSEDENLIRLDSGELELIQDLNDDENPTSTKKILKIISDCMGLDFQSPLRILETAFFSSERFFKEMYDQALVFYGGTSAQAPFFLIYIAPLSASGIGHFNLCVSNEFDRHDLLHQLNNALTVQAEEIDFQTQSSSIQLASQLNENLMQDVIEKPDDSGEDQELMNFFVNALNDDWHIMTQPEVSSQMLVQEDAPVLPTYDLMEISKDGSEDADLTNELTNEDVVILPEVNPQMPLPQLFRADDDHPRPLTEEQSTIYSLGVELGKKPHAPILKKTDLLGNLFKNDVSEESLSLFLLRLFAKIIKQEGVGFPLGFLLGVIMLEKRMSWILTSFRRSTDTLRVTWRVFWLVTRGVLIRIR